jgi:hypothetical protein
MEKTIEWYERVLDWNGDYYVFNKDACTELMRARRFILPQWPQLVESLFFHLI